MIVEKPFGTDLDSARELNRLVHRHFDEEQVFRIDHYLGKETVQNLMVFRFANGMFEPIWNRRYIDHVQITAAETVGVERRAAYYEGAGALRDMVQNHLMQLLSLVAMEPPIAFTAESVRDRKMDALLSVQPLLDDDAPDGPQVVRAQYARGMGRGRGSAGVPDRAGREPGLDDRDVRGAEAAARQLALGGRAVLHPHGQAAAEAHDRDRDPVPAAAAADLQARQRRRRSPPTCSSSTSSRTKASPCGSRPSCPGTRMQLAPVMMNFRYGTAFGGSVPEAYETLLLDAMLGDPTLFARHDFVEASWALITPVHERWRSAAAGADSRPTRRASGDRPRRMR